MKKLFFILVSVMGLQTVKAQNALQFDENNSYVYYQVVEKPGFSADTLFQRAQYFLKQNIPGKNNVKSSYETAAKGKFIVYTNSLVSRKEGGEIAYDLLIDTKDNKYRYKFSRFIFTPYKLNRYGVMEAAPGVEFPIEKLASRYSAKEVSNYVSQAGIFCNTSAGKLKSYMDKAPTVKKTSPVKKVDTHAW